MTRSSLRLSLGAALAASALLAGCTTTTVRPKDSRIITANGPEAAPEFADIFIRTLTAVEW